MREIEAAENEIVTNLVIAQGGGWPAVDRVWLRDEALRLLKARREARTLQWIPRAKEAK